MNDNKKPYEAGTRCPHCDGQMLDGGYIGRYCSNGPKCTALDVSTRLESAGVYQEAKCKEAADKIMQIVYAPCAVYDTKVRDAHYRDQILKVIEAQRKAAVEGFRARLLSALDDKLSPTISKLSTRNKALLEAMDIVEALEVEG